MKPLAACRPDSVRGPAEREARRELARVIQATGMSQERFAERLEASDDSVGRWLSGKARVPAWVLVAGRALLEAPRMAVGQ